MKKYRSAKRNGGDADYEINPCKCPKGKDYCFKTMPHPFSMGSYQGNQTYTCPHFKTYLSERKKTQGYKKRVRVLCDVPNSVLFIREIE